MEDYYKILKLNYGASDHEIKKHYRKLAMIYHPDKNKGDKKSEDVFKKVVEAYETLSNKKKREAYNIKYYYYSNRFNNPNSEKNEKKYHSYESNTTKENNATHNKFGSLFYTKRVYWFILLGIIIFYFLSIEKKTTTGNQKADKELEELKPPQRPESGEIDF